MGAKWEDERLSWAGAASCACSGEGARVINGVSGASCISDCDMGQLDMRSSGPDGRPASFSHSLPAVGPRYLDRPLLPSIRVPWEPLCWPSSTDCRAGLLEVLAPVGTLYRASAILAGGTEAGVRGEGPCMAYGSSAWARKARVLSSLWLLGVACMGIDCERS